MTRRNKKSHTTKFRGTRTCGGGNKKNRRGSGSRMGRAHIKSKGGGQRNIQHIYKYEPERLHLKGFVSMYKKGKSINLSDLKKLSNDPEIDVTKYGYIKILGKGELDKNIKKVVALGFSAGALEKIKKAGAVAETLGAKNGPENI